MIPRPRLDLAAWHDYMRRNRRANLAYAAEQAPRPTHRPCLGCGRPTRARDQRCNDCLRKP